MRTLLIDNYDSYTYNLYQLIAEVNSGEEPRAYSSSSTLYPPFLPSSSPPAPLLTRPPCPHPHPSLSLSLSRQSSS